MCTHKGLEAMGQSNTTVQRREDLFLFGVRGMLRKILGHLRLTVKKESDYNLLRRGKHRKWIFFLILRMEEMSLSRTVEFDTPQISNRVFSNQRYYQYFLFFLPKF